MSAEPRWAEGDEQPRPRFRVGTWVEVTRRREGGPDIVLRGKVVSASLDHAAIECRIADGPHTIYWRGDDTPHILVRRLSGREFQRQRRR